LVEKWGTITRVFEEFGKILSQERNSSKETLQSVPYNVAFNKTTKS